MLGIILDRQSEQPLKRQLYVALREQMILGRLHSGSPLPSTRELARALNISRNTACEAYAMLLAEGFLSSRPGAQTVVVENLSVQKQPDEPREANYPRAHLVADFRTGRPDISLFPKPQWLKAMRRALQELPPEEYGYAAPQGLKALRDEIASFLYRGRGLIVHPEDIFITAGATHAIHIAAGIVKANGRALLAEDPCHTGMRKTFLQAGCSVLPVPADAMGMMTERLPAGTNACCLYVTPSHQFPLGGILPAVRRAALTRYAQEKGMYIIEDDYDSEFRYAGDPVAPLHVLDPSRVIYIGTFSKTLFPAIRIGYAVVPRSLQKMWLTLRTYTDVQNPPFEQAALALLLKEGTLERHIQKMRRVYGLRRDALLFTLRDAFGDGCSPLGDAAGLHMAVQFPGCRFDAAFHKHCLELGLYVTPAQYHSIEEGRCMDTLILGFGHLAPEEIQSGIALLQKVISGRAARQID